MKSCLVVVHVKMISVVSTLIREVFYGVNQRGSTLRGECGGKDEKNGSNSVKTFVKLQGPLVLVGGSRGKQLYCAKD